MYVHWQLISFDAQCGQTFYQYTIAISNSNDFTRYSDPYPYNTKVAPTAVMTFGRIS